MHEKIDITVQKEEFTSTIEDKEKIKPLSKPKCSLPVRSHRRGFSIFLPPSGDNSKEPSSQQSSNKGFLPGPNFNREQYDTVDAGGPLATTPEDEILERIFSPRNKRHLPQESNQPQQQTVEVEVDSFRP
ncbi:TPA: hypothetical protein JA361_07875 [Legionella pneumophila]|nr:hypothetical protein [Legionella pneumophila]HAT8182626.1 hypothetical protein [Legionella pneumophila]